MVKIQDDKITLIVNDKNHSSAAIEVGAEYNGKMISISLNIQYLLDILSLLSGSIVKIYVKSETEPLLLEDAANVDCKFVLMPLII